MTSDHRQGSQILVYLSLRQPINKEGIELMFMEDIACTLWGISDSNLIFKFLKGLDLDLFLFKPQFKHFNHFLNLMMSETYNGKISALKHCHWTSFGRFLNDSPWDDVSISKRLQDDLISCIYNRYRQTKHPIYVMIDDTTCVKTKPSSQAPPHSLLMEKIIRVGALFSPSTRV